MSDHIVSSFDKDLLALSNRLAEMGGLAERVVGDSVQALTHVDQALAAQVIAEDKRIDELHRVIEEQVVAIIARRQPVAADLRLCVAAIRISNDLERVGDLAKNIAKRAIAINGQLLSKQLAVGVDHLAEIAMEQLKNVLDAYVALDAGAATQVRNRDNEIDALYTSLFRELLTYMMEDPRNITQCTHLLFCAKNIERIGDHATNIAETILYVATGEVPSEDRPRAPDAAP